VALSGCSGTTDDSTAPPVDTGAVAPASSDMPAGTDASAPMPGTTDPMPGVSSAPMPGVLLRPGARYLHSGVG
jgi:hypothetical protein